MTRNWFAKGQRGMTVRRIRTDRLRAGFTSGPLGQGNVSRVRFVESRPFPAQARLRRHNPLLGGS